jgi:hypothetical protein
LAEPWSSPTGIAVLMSSERMQMQLVEAESRVVNRLASESATLAQRATAIFRQCMERHSKAYVMFLSLSAFPWRFCCTFLFVSFDPVVTSDGYCPYVACLCN